MKKTAWIYPSIIYLIGITITLVYAFTNNYTVVSDTAREYLIYTSIIEGKSLQAFWGVFPYTLQSTSLSTTLFPALLQKVTGIEPLLLFKLYSSFLIPLLPVVVYFIAKRFMPNLYAFLAAVFFMGQVVFLHAPSIARSNIALLFLALSLLVILHLGLSKKVKFPILFVLAIGMVISHYSTTFISLFILLGTGIIILLWQLLKREQLPYRNSILVVCLSLIVGITVWYGLITQTPFAEYLAPGSEQEHRITDITSRDKITQAAFGIKNPDGDTTFTFNWATFAFNWLVVMLMSYGLLITLIRWRREKAVPLEYLVLSIIGYITIVAVVILPFVSRAYGIERTYYQMLTFLSIYFIFGCSDVARRLRLKPYMVILPVLLPYCYFIYTTGIIHSILGE